jgi:hypothetical protein
VEDVPQVIWSALVCDVKRLAAFSIVDMLEHADLIVRAEQRLATTSARADTRGMNG